MKMNSVQYLTWFNQSVFSTGNSQPELAWLLHNTKNSTLTIWGQDQLNEHQVQQLKSLIASLHSKVYLDMSPQLQNRILQTWNKKFSLSTCFVATDYIISAATLVGKNLNLDCYANIF